MLIALAFATCCFLNFWGALAERRTVYFLKRDPVFATLPEVIGWEIVLTIAMLGLWGSYRKRPQWRLTLEKLFLVLCLLPAGIVAAELVRLAPSELTRWIQMRWSWTAVVAISIALLGYAAKWPAASARSM